MSGQILNPIFIVGAPRSGTSLLRVMLNRHPAIGLSDELYFFYYVYNRRHHFGNLQDLEERQLLIDRYLETDRIRRLNLDLKALSAILFEQGDNYESFYITLMQFYATSTGKSRYGEKTPQNAYNADILCSLFPNGSLIHIIRDPRDVVASLLKMPWGSRSVLSNLRIWKDCNRQAKECENFNSYIPVYYENLVKRPEIELRRICEFIGEEFIPEMLDSDNRTNTDKWWFQRAQEPLTQSRIDSWKDTLTNEDVGLIEWMVGTQMQEFGYQFSGYSLSFLSLIRNMIANGWDLLKEKFIQLPRMWYFWFQPTQLAKEEAWNDFRNKGS